LYKSLVTTTPAPPWRIGVLAQRTGVTVRALRHYDALGLLKPSHRTDAGHRLYTRRDIERLQQIRSLRQLGLSLAEVRTCLLDRRVSVRRIVSLHLERARAAVKTQQTLVQTLEQLNERLKKSSSVRVDEFVRTVEAITMSERYFSPEEQEFIRQRAELVGAERIRQVEQHEWPTLIAEVQAKMDRGTDPSDPTVQALAKRWKSLVAEFTGGNAGVAEGVRRQYATEDPNPAQRRRLGLTREMFQYVGRAMATTTVPEPGEG
jgi:MerR family transcriptional regulator, thiopeptide resistance regulator